MKVDLDTAVTDYLSFRKSLGVAPNTVRQGKYILARFLASCGRNIQLKSVSDAHVTNFFSVAAETRGQAALKIDYSVLKGFFEWSRSTRRVPPSFDPMAGRKAPKVGKKERRRVAPHDFPRLLDAASHPRDRMVLALGLYTLLRGSEICTLRVRDANLDQGELLVKIHKSGKEDTMVIVPELDRELRQWLTFYTNDQGGISDEWLLTPAKTGSLGRYNPETRLLESVKGASRLRPTVPITNAEAIAQRSLVRIGFMDAGVAGEGMHTLRRSGARAWYEELRDAYPDAKEIVREALHHESVTTTERYIGIESGRQRRNDVMRGRMMYSMPVVAGVTQLRRTANGDGDQELEGV